MAERHAPCCPSGAIESGLGDGIKQLHKHVGKKARGFLTEFQVSQHSSESCQKIIIIIIILFAFHFSCTVWVCKSKLFQTKEPQNWDGRVYLPANITHLILSVFTYRTALTQGLAGGWNISAEARTWQVPGSSNNTAWVFVVLGYRIMTKGKNRERKHLSFHFV